MTNKTNQHADRAQQLQEELQHFSGDLIRYRHSLNRSVIYTPGVRHLTEKAEAYWLIDAICSWIGSPEFQQGVRDEPRIGDLHFWKLNVDRNKNSAVLHAETDSDVKPFIVQNIEFTDFPLETVAIWAGFDGTHWTLYLPSEH